MGQKVRTLEGLRPQLDAYSEAVSDFHTDRRVAELPERLARLWQKGIPLSKLDIRLETPIDRKAELLRFWESRTENRWGMQVRATVEVFIREEIQYSDDAFTAEEISRFNATRKCKAALNLERPWDEIEKALAPESSEP